MIRTKSKPDSLSTLIKKADDVVSLFVRLNAADDNGTIKCISCNESVFWKDADCCHLKDRDNMATRYYIPNLAAGCRDCNRFNHFDHIIAWEKKLTPEFLTHLNFISHGMQKYTIPELQDLIETYTEKVKQLKKQKHL